MTRRPPTRRDALAVLVGAAASCGLGPAAARPFDDVAASGVLRVAVYRDNAPFSDDGDKGPVGIDVDLARKIAEKLGVKADIRVIDPSENVDGDMRLSLWRGDLAQSALADVMLHVPYDKQLEFRNELVFFTRPYVEQRLAVAWRKGALEGGFQGLGDLEGRTIALEGTGPADLMIQFADAGRYRESARHFRDFAGAAKAFLDGETDFLGGSRAAVEATVFPKRDGFDVKDIAAPGPIRPRWELCGAVRTDSRDLAYRIGEALSALEESGETKAIFAAYGVTYAPPPGY